MDRDPPKDPTRRRVLVASGLVSLLAAEPASALGGPEAPPPRTRPDGGPPVSDQAFEVPAGQTRAATHFKMKGVTSNTLDVKVSGVDVGGRMAVLEQHGQSPNGGPPMHRHADQDEVFYGIEGTYHFEVGGEHFVLEPGDVIFAPRGVPHAFIQVTDEARMMLVYQPAGQIEAFFAATAAWTSPPTADEVARVFAAHGMTVVGPPLKPG